ncbi:MULTISPECIES: bestrophin family protein [unclassified Pseudomonas]|uniref:bestrophin family protein n=1 Tax=unclassified Pseudomonas TaxID=196821 RepID=UPI002AC8FB2E|nr:MULTISPECIES: bestrophin family protein [unclassified Pseudomonas]MEB0045149.1 bestrophin family protein [Pseudomonas sp. Dout3]MEB0096495.1 bestrophin family protein [Pseudomonas sp. DC1.2]WPX61446.1 bestrophin family protein [Pseudomonas sp. DC1.2]
MIVRPKPNLIGILFSLKGSIAKRIALRCLLVTLLACAIVLVETWHPAFFSKVNATPFTLLGLSLSIFMSFRNNACYDRWWEGRKQLGQLIIDVRSLLRQTQELMADAERERLLRELCGFAHGLIARLRHENETNAVRDWTEPPIDSHHPNITDALLQRIGARCSSLAKSGQISEWRYTQLETRLISLSQVQASCERIKHTPLPFPYTLLLHRTIYLFCILLPFAMAEPLGWLTPVFTAIVSYTFLGLDEIGDDLEDPFGFDENDLPCDAILRTVEREVLAALGQTDLPPALEPVDYLLN